MSALQIKEGHYVTMCVDLAYDLHGLHREVYKVTIFPLTHTTAGNYGKGSIWGSRGSVLFYSCGSRCEVVPPSVCVLCVRYVNWLDHSQDFRGVSSPTTPSTGQDWLTQIMIQNAPG